MTTLCCAKESVNHIAMGRWVITFTRAKLRWWRWWQPFGREGVIDAALRPDTDWQWWHDGTTRYRAPISASRRVRFGYLTVRIARYLTKDERRDAIIVIGPVRFAS